MPVDTIYASGKVSVALLNLRNNPDGAVIKVLPQFTRVDILGRTGDWLQVLVEGKPGYVAVKYINVQDNQIIPEQKKKRGRVTAAVLNFRVSPRGEIIQALAKDTLVNILEEIDGWLKIEVNKLTGYVSKKYIQVTVDEPPTLSTDITENSATNILEENFSYQDKTAISPDGVKFGTKFRKGIFHYGETSIKEYVENNVSRFPAKLNSSLNVMMSASENEGKYEAINTWDNSFLSFGIFQWTCGAGTAAGELPSLLARLEKSYPQTFDKFFGQYGLSCANINERKGTASRGFFRLDGILLNDRDKKNKLRTLVWAYRFWSAGFDHNMREIETLHAINRIGVFYRQANRKIGEFYIADYISSEYGVALLLDQHVNRPGHVPKILAQAVDALSNQLPINDPLSWSDAEEALLITQYLQLRNNTSMTHSQKRAETIQSKVAQGLISAQRGTFKFSVDAGNNLTV